MNSYGKIVFASGRQTDFDIWSLNLDEGTLSQLTSGGALNDFPKWSPDGSRIAYISTGVDCIASLWVMNADGSNRRRLTENHYCQFPSWSPDGTRILFTSNAANAQEIDICAIHVDGAPRIESLLQRRGTETQPSWSPDGASIVFAGPESVEPGIASRNMDIWEYVITTKELRRLTSHPAKDYYPVYSPDGSQIAFVSHRNTQSDVEYFAELKHAQEAVAAGNMASLDESIRKIHALEKDSDLWIMDRDGRNLRPLTDNRYIDTGLSWSPCGRFIVYTCAPKHNHETERLRIVEVATGTSHAIPYDRTPLMVEIGAEGCLNRTFLERLIPDFIERRFVDHSFWGEERHPDWTR